MNLIRFESIVGHEVTQQPAGGLVSVQTLCDCSGEGALFYATDKDLDSALRKLHDLVYRHHAKIVFERQKYCCSRCGRRLPLDPHHKVRRSKGRDDRITNLEGLDRACHEAATNPR